MKTKLITVNFKISNYFIVLLYFCKIRTLYNGGKNELSKKL